MLVTSSVAYHSIEYNTPHWHFPATAVLHLFSCVNISKGCEQECQDLGGTGLIADVDLLKKDGDFVPVNIA